MRKKKDTVELNLRLPAEGWKDLTALLAALLGTTSGEGAQRGAVENPTFDETMFRRLDRAEAGIAQEQHYRVAGSVDEPLSVPAPAGYGMETAESGAFERSAEASRDGAEQRSAAEDWERRWERDCRRYDSGFPIR